MKIRKIVGMIAIVMALALSMIAITGVLNIAKDRDKNDENEETTVPSVTEPVITGPSISGAWFFDKPTSTNKEATYSVNFTSNGNRYSSITTLPTSDFDLKYDDLQVVSCYFWLDQTDSQISPYCYVDFGNEPQVVTAEFIEFMETNATKLEVSGVYKPSSDSLGMLFDDNFAVNFLYSEEDDFEVKCRGFYCKEEAGDLMYMLDVVESDDITIGSIGSWWVNTDQVIIDFGETPQSVSIDCWIFIHSHFTKTS